MEMWDYRKYEYFNESLQNSRDCNKKTRLYSLKKVDQLLWKKAQH